MRLLLTLPRNGRSMPLNRTESSIFQGVPHFNFSRLLCASLSISTLDSSKLTVIFLVIISVRNTKFWKWTNINIVINFRLLNLHVYYRRAFAWSACLHEALARQLGKSAPSPDTDTWAKVSIQQSRHLFSSLHESGNWQKVRIHLIRIHGRK